MLLTYLLTYSNSTTAICCGFVVQLVSRVDKILTDSASEVAELLVLHVEFFAIDRVSRYGKRLLVSVRPSLHNPSHL